MAQEHVCNAAGWTNCEMLEAHHVIIERKLRLELRIWCRLNAYTG